jgi:protoporphyrinogen oxidase/GT2 family glycosyltransferase
MTQIAILGAGIAGLSSAWLLRNSGIDPIVFERQSYPGGLARSFDWHGFQCDFAAHRLFTTDENVLHKLLNLVPMGRHVRRSQIFMNGKWMRDPLDALELAGHSSPITAAGMLWHYLIRPRDISDDNFEKYVLRRYGSSLYKLFFKPYTEKLFGIPGDQISAYWARKKVRLSNPFDRFRENTKTKFQYFYYPVRGGYGAISDMLFEEVEDRVRLNTTVTRLDADADYVKAVHYIQEGEEKQLPVDHVISTLPLSITARMLGYDFHLNYRKVEAVYLLLNRPLLSDYHWMYFVDADVAINRMVEFKNMSPVDAPQNQTVVCAEVTQDHDDPAAEVISDLARIGLINKNEVLDTLVVRENFSYPVYDQAFDETIEIAESTIGEYKNLSLVGRAAEFKHREVDDNFAAASELVGSLINRYPPIQPAYEEEISMSKSSSHPKVSVVILTYNHYEDTRECLNSVQKCNYPNVNIILVDNGSEDETPAKVREEFPKIQVIENGANIGVPAGYNIGFQEALAQASDYIFMLNNDTVIAPDIIDELLEVANADPDAGIVMPKVLFYGSSDRVWSSGGRYRAFPPAILMTDRRAGNEDKLRMIEYAPSCGLLIHRQAFERAGLFDPGYFFLWDDWDFSERVRAHGLKIWYAPNARMWHKVSTTTQGSRSPLFWKTLGASITRFYRRHGRPPWLSMTVHIGYVVLREFLVKQNWAYWGDFWSGVSEGLQKPLGSLPQVASNLKASE